MKRNQSKAIPTEQQFLEDIQFLLSSIRARQNGLIFFLQHFTRDNEENNDQYRLYKNQFLQKQKIYSGQVADIMVKYSSPLDIFQHLLRGFWLKLKSIIKVSLERIKILDLLNERIFQRYEEIISLINANYDKEKGINDFKLIQECLKRRNIDALILGRNHCSIKSQSKLSKNRSETLIKNQRQYEQPYPFGLKIGLNPQKQILHPRLKSLNRYKVKKGEKSQKMKISSLKISEKHHKKFQKNIQRYEKNIQNVTSGKIDVIFDKRKTIFQNVYSMYDTLFQKNIPIHKTISKFVFNSCGLSKLISQQQKKKKHVHSKFGQSDGLRYSSKLHRKKRGENIDIEKKFRENQKNRTRTIKSAKFKKKMHFMGNSLTHKNVLSKIN